MSSLHFLDAYGLPGKDLAEIYFFLAETAASHFLPKKKERV
jgi:hypothetical protein